jgi:hypothetical protein
MRTAQTAQECLPNIHSLTSDARKKFMRKKFSAVSRLQREFGRDAVELDCRGHAEKLRREVIRLLAEKGVPVPGNDLENLHRTLTPELKAYNFDDGVNKATTLLYDTDEQFAAAYHDTVAHCLQKHFPYPLYFQATPTIRIHCPDGENSNHYPRYHTDINYGHPPEEINIWLPLTRPVAPQYHGFRHTDVENTRHILEEFDYDFAPLIERAIQDKPFNFAINRVAPQVTTEFGKLLAFDSRCLHTGEPLESHTRVSLDIRIIAVEDFNTLEVEYQGTGRRKIRYVPGQAYYPVSSGKIYP